MAKKVEGYIKLQIPAGKATPAPPVGPALGQHGVNIVEFTKQFNAKTADAIFPVPIKPNFIVIPSFLLFALPMFVHFRVENV